MMPVEKVEKFIKNVPLETRNDRDREILSDALKALQEPRKHAGRQQNVWKAIMKSRTTRLAAAAAVALAIVVGIGTFDRTGAWAKVLRAIEEVNQVHIRRTFAFPDGRETQAEYWFRKPDCLRQEEPHRIVIDNGRERLTIAREKKEAQFEDSWVEYQPVSDYDMFEEIEMFRGHKVEGLTVKKLEDESDDNVTVFRLDYVSPPSRLTYQGKAWVDRATMLPSRMTLHLRGEPKEGEPEGVEVICDYSPIPDDVFDRVVPDGYTVLPRKRRQAISGKVVDVNGSPVQRAAVHLTDKSLRFLREVETDSEGEFVFELPPSSVRWVGLPIFLRAVPPNDPAHVAWTIVEDPTKRKDRGVTIPGRVGNVEMNNALFVQCVDGIVLQMESAGTLSGRVTDMQGTPISQAEVVVEGRAVVRKPGMPLLPEFGFIGGPMAGADPRGELTTRTDEQGRYEVTNVPKFSGRAWYEISASAPGFATNRQRIDMIWKSNVEQADMKLYRAGITVLGTLVDNYGQPLDMRRIVGRVDVRDFCNTKTDKEGRFILTDCPISPELQIKAELSDNPWPPSEKEKYRSYRYYPDVIVPINYREGTTEYQVKLVAEKPEFTVDLEVKNAAGEPVVRYPIELQGASGTTSVEWEEHGGFTRRTDQQGCCKFTQVPNIKDLRLVVGRAHIWNDALSKEEAERAREMNAKYEWKIVPVRVIPGQKEYHVEVTLGTTEESKDKQ